MNSVSWDKVYKGVLLKEGLEDVSVLDALNVTKTETWAVSNNAQIQPPQWAAIYFEVNEESVSHTAEELSRALKSHGWYTTLLGDDDIFVVFPNRVFRYKKGDQVARQEAIAFGQTIGIPADQLNWKE